MNNKSLFIKAVRALPLILLLACAGNVATNESLTEQQAHAPKITSITPASGYEGTLVTITGFNFKRNDTELVVTFNGIQADEIIAVSDTGISVKVPTSAATGPISVTKASQTAIGPGFVVETPVNFKIAFIGDSHIGRNAAEVLRLIKGEGAQAVVHPGDLNYSEVPKDFEDHIKGILGVDFPYFYSIGNHDDTVWDGSNGYQSLQEKRLNNLKIQWRGRLGVQSSFSYQGIFFVCTAPDELGISPAAAGNYIKEQLSVSNAIWNIAFWHKNQRLMQIGGKSNEAGWTVYENSRKGGAIVATAHEHSYSRTYEMSNFETQNISSTNNIINLRKNDPATTIDEGKSFAFVSGLGGKSIRDAESDLDSNPWWASVSSASNNGQYGALFGEFNYNGDASLAHFYFKDINGKIVDDFFVRSHN